MPTDDIAAHSLPKSQKSDRIIATAGDWALATDGIQWILLRLRTRKAGPYWNAVSFVRSTKDILERCMREKGTDERSARLLLAGLPDSFDGKPLTSLTSLRPRGLPRQYAHLKTEILPDPKYPGMWRVRNPDGSLSDMVNLTRAIDAVLARSNRT